MRKLGDCTTSSLVFKNFDKALHVRLRTASVKHSMSVKAIVTEACNLWLKEKYKKIREAKTREAQKRDTNRDVGSNPASPPKTDGAVA